MIALKAFLQYLPNMLSLRIHKMQPTFKLNVLKKIDLGPNLESANNGANIPAQTFKF